jgi:hypothetical protein
MKQSNLKPPVPSGRASRSGCATRRTSIAQQLTLAILCSIALALGCESTGKRGRTSDAAPGTKAGNAGTQANEGAKPGAPVQTAPDGSAIPENKLEADPTLLGLSYDDAALGIRFSPPRGWPPLEPEMMEQTRQAFDKMSMAQQDDQFVSKPVRMFYEKDKRYFMILSEFTSWPAPVDPVAKMEEYRSRVAARNPGSVIQYGMYRHGKLVIFHMLLSNQVIADTRIVVMRDGHGPVQIDYLVPVQLYDTVMKGIESSIGSIQPL